MAPMRESSALRWILAVMLVLSGCEGGGGEDAGAQGDAALADGGSDAAPPTTCPVGSARIEERCDPELVPCGGELSGEHCYAEVCFEKNELLREPLMQPGIPDGCTVDDLELRGSTGTIEGSLAFSGGELARRVTSAVTGTLWLPARCQIVAGDCDVMTSFFRGALAPSGWATCEADAGGCECDLELEWEAEGASTYTIEGETIVTGDGLRFDYCVETEGGLRVREASEPGLATAVPAPG